MYVCVFVRCGDMISEGWDGYDTRECLRGVCVCVCVSCDERNTDMGICDVVHFPSHAELSITNECLGWMIQMVPHLPES